MPTIFQTLSWLNITIHNNRKLCCLSIRFVFLCISHFTWIFRLSFLRIIPNGKLSHSHLSFLSIFLNNSILIRSYLLFTIFQITLPTRFFFNLLYLFLTWITTFISFLFIFMFFLLFLLFSFMLFHTLFIILFILFFLITTFLTFILFLNWFFLFIFVIIFNH